MEHGIKILKEEFPGIKIEEVGYSWYLIVEKKTLGVRSGSYSGNAERYTENITYNPNWITDSSPVELRDLQVYVKDIVNVNIDPNLNKRLKELDLNLMTGDTYVHYVFSFTE